MIKELEVVVGDGESPEVTQMANEVRARGGRSASYWTDLIPEIEKLKPETLLILGKSSAHCVADLAKRAVEDKELGVGRVVINVRKIRGDDEDVGNNNNLSGRLHDLESRLGKDILSDPRILIIP